MTALESFKQIYSESRSQLRDKYDCKEAFVDIDFSKTNGRYKGQDLINLKAYIYAMLLQGKRFKEIAVIVDLEVSTVRYHFTNYQPEYKKHKL